MWRNDILKEAARITPPSEWAPIHLSGHACGSVARGLMMYDPAAVVSILGFPRVQVNGFFPEKAAELVAVSRDFSMELILQTPSIELLEPFAAFAKTLTCASLLLDGSAGTGLFPERLPPPTPDVAMGYAGGIGPTNVEGVLEVLSRFDAEGWIDMETGVRTDDKFDLTKVRRVLELARPFVGKQA